MPGIQTPQGIFLDLKPAIYEGKSICSTLETFTMTISEISYHHFSTQFKLIHFFGALVFPGCFEKQTVHLQQSADARFISRHYLKKSFATQALFSFGNGHQALGLANMPDAVTTCATLWLDILFSHENNLSENTCK